MISGGSLINDSFMLNITTLGQSIFNINKYYCLSVVFNFFININQEA